MTIPLLRRPAGRSLRPLLVALAVALVLVLATGTGPAGAQPSASALAEQLAATGSSVPASAATDAELQDAIERANSANIAVAVLADPIPADEIEGYTRDVLAAVEDRDAPYRTVLVVSATSVGAYSDSVSDLGQVLRQDGPAFRAFALGDTADGIRRFTDEVTGVAPSAPAPTAPAAGSDDGGGGGGFPWTALLVAIAIAGLGFGGYRLYQQRQQRRSAEALVVEERAELGEQLRDNADRVITLGDAVLAGDDRELVDLYARASETYRDVSHRLEGASSLDAVRQLDQRLDEAEWQFEVIEARLAGRTPPPRPPLDPGGPDAGRPGPAGPAGPGAGGRDAGSPGAARGDLGGPDADRGGGGTDRRRSPGEGSGPPPASPGATSATGPGRTGQADLGSPDDGPVLGPGESLFGTTLPPVPPSRAGRVLRPSRRRGWHGRRR